MSTAQAAAHEDYLRRQRESQRAKRIATRRLIANHQSEFAILHQRAREEEVCDA